MALIEADGVIHGTVGGGAVEAEAQRQARLVASSRTAVLFDFDLGGPGLHEAGPICGGSMRLLVDASAVACRDAYRQAAAALARRERGLWLTTLRHRARLEVRSRFVLEKDLVMGSLDGSKATRWDQEPGRAGPLGRPVLGRRARRSRPTSKTSWFMESGPLGAEALRSCLAREASQLFDVPPGPEGEQVEVFVAPLIPRPVLLIVGGGHIGQALAAQATLVGFEILVLDDRPEFADPSLFPPGVKTRCGDVAREIAAFPVQSDTFIVLVTRGHQSDAAALRACISRPAAYIGMIGSRRKVPLLRREFLEQGWATGEQFDRVHAPIGLDIGAVSVPEIAASIVAQMIAVRRKGAAP